MNIRYRFSNELENPYFNDAHEMTITLPPEDFHPRLRGLIIAMEHVKAANLLHNRKVQEFWNVVVEET